MLKPCLCQAILYYETHIEPITNNVSFLPTMSKNVCFNELLYTLITPGDSKQERES